MNAAVATARCLSYERAQVRRAVRQCVEALPELQELLHQSSRVLLKPNLLSSTRPPEHHVNTHPAVVRAIAELLTAEFGCKVAIGDSCGTLKPGATAQALRISGMEKVAQELGCELYNVDTRPRHLVEFPEGRIWRQIPLPADLDQFDLVISVAKLKTHSLTFVTGPVKNMLGLVPAAAKKRAHAIAPRPEEFASLLCDLFALVRPAAAFVDGIVGMEGRGPNNGRPKRVELVAASCDPVALDAFCAEVMHFEPLKIPLLAECQQRGLGIADPQQIQVRGEPVEAFKPKKFAHPPTGLSGLLSRLLPRRLTGRLIERLFGRRAFIRQDRCIRCGECRRNCPGGAIQLDQQDGTYRVDPKRCLACYCCDEVCPADAIAFRSGL